jgi:DNA-binding transcriptional LysR family regulator
MSDDFQKWESRIGRRIKLRDLHVLTVVVQSGSMAKAAVKLAISQPAISESIAGLEATLGVRLLDRGAWGVEPTPYAHVLLKRGAVVFDELMQGVRDIEFLTNPKAGVISVSSGDTAAAGLLDSIIDRMACRYPRITVCVSQASAEPLAYPELRDRQVDVALVRVSSSFAHGDLEVERLFDDPPRVVVGASNPLARRRKLALSDLVDEAWALTSDQVIRDLISEAFRSSGLGEPRVVVSASSMLLRQRLIATGRYVTVLPQSVVRCNAKPWALKALPIELSFQPMSVNLITVRKRTLSPLVRLFMEEARVRSRALRNP